LSARIPKLDPPGRRGLGSPDGGRRPVDLRDEWTRLAADKALNLRSGRDEVGREYRKRCITDYHEQAHAMSDHRVELVRLVPDPAIVSDRYPPLRACALQPFSSGVSGAKSSEWRTIESPAS